MQDEKNFKWTEQIRECLDSTLVAVLATRGEDGVWATPIYFSYDEKFNFYFISPMSTRHMLDIKTNPRVALAIISPASHTGVNQIGVQIEGRAEEVPDKDIETVYETRSRRIAGDSEWAPMPEEGHFVKEHGGVFMKIVVDSMNYVDTRFFGGNSKIVPLAKLRSRN